MYVRMYACMHVSDTYDIHWYTTVLQSAVLRMPGKQRTWPHLPQILNTNPKFRLGSETRKTTSVTFEGLKVLNLKWPQPCWPSHMSWNFIRTYLIDQVTASWPRPHPNIPPRYSWLQAPDALAVYERTTCTRICRVDEWVNRVNTIWPCVSAALFFSKVECLQHGHKKQTCGTGSRFKGVQLSLTLGAF